MRRFVLLAFLSSALVCDAAPFAYPFAFNPLAPVQAMTNTGFEAGKGAIHTGLTGLQAGANLGFNTLSAMGQYLNPFNMLQAGTQSLGLAATSGVNTLGSGISQVGSGLAGMGSGLNGLGTSLGSFSETASGAAITNADTTSS